MPIPTCTCGSAKAVADFNTLNRLMQFLMGLNDCYDNVKNQILVMEPLPSVNRAYSLILRVEKQREVHVTFNENIESTGLFAKTQSNAQSYKRDGTNKGNTKKTDFSKKDKDSKFCDHCNVKGHMKETCFKLYGYPDWYKELKEQQGKSVSRSMANMVDTPLDFGTEKKLVGKADKQMDLASMVQQEVLKLMKGKMLVEGSHVNFANLDNYAGPAD
ncbi:uncharacterized protein LOC123209672 [Mangifera indica]|uniref:uncharacterized protein LOC123209672 n=1 Tax=Mangifera indica TaxID=29780 RepID=UPI001CFA3737|nr:uncharacterized protein LOC123209672 [Mangifera indica]